MCTREMYTSGMDERLHVYYIERCTHREWVIGMHACVLERCTHREWVRGIYVHVY